MIEPISSSLQSISRSFSQLDARRPWKVKPTCTSRVSELEASSGNSRQRTSDRAFHARQSLRPKTQRTHLRRRLPRARQNISEAFEFPRTCNAARGAGFQCHCRDRQKIAFAGFRFLTGFHRKYGPVPKIAGQQINAYPGHFRRRSSPFPMLPGCLLVPSLFFALLRGVLCPFPPR